MQLSSPAAPIHAKVSSLSPGADANTHPGLYIVGDDAVGAICSSGPLATSYAVENIPTLAAALSRVMSMNRAIIVTELQLPDGDGAALCRALNTGRQSVLVLAVTSDPTRVPAALIAGCTSVLLKPFAANLLFARLGRLTRDLKTWSAFPAAAITLGTNELWPAIVCPSCGHSGATSFDSTSMRRWWYACLECQHVWITKRQR
jgi:DNA-binding response OmpR family regulator